MKKFFKKYLVIVVLLLIVVIGLLEYSQNIGSLNSVVAAVFDSSLLPSKDNTWNLGLKQKLETIWHSGRFSRTVGVGIGLDRDVAPDTDTTSDALVLGPTATTTGEGGQLKLLGTSLNNYFVLDNYGNDLRILMRGSEGKELERVRIAESVNGTARPGILIGTSSTMAPGERLEVVGNIISKGTEWTQGSVLPFNNWRRWTYGNGLFVNVACGVSSAGCNATNGNRVITTQDGVNWNSYSASANNLWADVTYGNGLFVAVSSDGFPNQIMTSPDGKNWTPRISAANNAWTSVTYGNGRFVAVSLNGFPNQIMSSSDGINWNTNISPLNALWYSVVYGNDRFVAMSGSNVAMYSLGGQLWQASALPASRTWTDIAYGNGLFIAVASDIGCSSMCIISSPDGINWSPVTLASTYHAWNTITYGNGLFVAMSHSGAPSQLMTSPDGISWTARIAPTNIVQGVAYGNGLFIALVWNNAQTSVSFMTSGKMDYQITPHNNIYQGGMTILGSATGTLSVGTTTFPGLFTVASSSVAFIVMPDGKIGLGTSTPDSALTFKGQLLIVDQNNSNNYSELNASTVSTTITSRGAGSSFIPLNFNFDKGIIFMASTSDATGLIMKEAGNVSSTGYWFLGGPEVPRNGKGGLRIGPNDANNFGQISAPTFAGVPSSLFITNDSGVIYMDANRVGIGTTSPAAGTKLQIFGNLQVGSAPGGGRIQNFNQTQFCVLGSCASDIRLKKDINPLNGLLDTVIRLKPTYYSWRSDEFPEFGFYAGARNLGLIAQDVEKVFPNLVGKNISGYKTVDYVGPDLTVYLIEAIKELNTKTDAIQSRIKTLESNSSR